MPREEARKNKRVKYREKVYRIVREIPKGKVMTYGQLAEILGKGYTPRTVGFTLKALDDAEIPWQRVINSRGACSTGKITAPIGIQQVLLEKEGIEFNEKGVCNLKEYQWGAKPFVAEHKEEEFSLFEA